MEFISKTNFQNKKSTKKKKHTSCKCLSLIMLDSVIRISKEYYPRTFRSMLL